MKTIEVIYGDCRDELKKLVTHKFDTCITDPPYHKDNENELASKEGYGTGVPEFKSWLWEVKRIVKPNGHILVWEHPYNLEDLLLTGKELGLVYKGILIWNATNRHQPYKQPHPFNRFDVCVWWVKHPATKWTFNFNKCTDIWSEPVVIGDGTVPGAKPLSIIKDIVKQFTNENDWIIDPFAGSGTTARACLEMNRNCVTIEIRNFLKEELDTRLTLNIPKEHRF